MSYYEFLFSHTSPHEQELVNDLLSGQLAGIGFESFVTRSDSLAAYIAEEHLNKELIKETLEEFPLDDTTLTYSYTLLEDKNWNEEWEKNYFKPIRIDKKCIIRSSFHPHEPGYEYELIINPKMAFGTGHHETTHLMIEFMMQADLQEREVLDMGCGTALLAILAAKKGARRVVAIDNDEWAYLNAQENADLNETTTIDIRHGGGETMMQCGTFDEIFANITRNILMELIPHFSTLLHPGGQLYLSGFYDTDVDDLAACCQRYEIDLIARNSQNRWTALKLEKRKKPIDK